MLKVREKVLEESVKRQLNDRAVKRINNRLNRLKTESSWKVTYRWVSARRRLLVATGPLDWEANFGKRIVKIYVEGPIFMKLVLAPAKKMTIAVLKEEISLLSK